jgi:electron transport complex protein RnfD
MEFTSKKPPIVSNQGRSYKRQLTLHISLLIVSLAAVFTRAFIPVAEGATWTPDVMFKSFLMLLVGAFVSVIIELLYALTEGKAQEFGSYQRWVDPLNTGLLIALLLPSSTPIYVLVLAVLVGVYAGKIVFGGYGYYIFNPVLVGVLFATLSFSSQIDYGNTPLIQLSEALLGGQIDFQLIDLFVGNYDAVAIGSTAAIILILIMIYLFVNKVIDLRSSGVFVLAIVLISFSIGFVLYGFNLGLILTYILVNFLTGLTLFATIFLLSETVSSPTSREAKMIYATVAAILTMLVRVLGTNPEGVVFAVLFGNMITPFLNRTVTRSNQRTFIWTGAILLAIVLFAGLVIGFILQGRIIEANNVVTLLGGVF